MKTLTREVSEQPFGSVLRRILWFISSAAAGLSVPWSPSHSEGEAEKCANAAFRAAAIDMHTRGQLLLSRVEPSSACMCVA